MIGCHTREWEVNLEKKYQKYIVENEKGPLSCYRIWNSVLERLG